MDKTSPLASHVSGNPLTASAVAGARIQEWVRRTALDPPLRTVEFPENRKASEVR